MLNRIVFYGIIEISSRETSLFCYFELYKARLWKVWITMTKLCYDDACHDASSVFYKLKSSVRLITVKQLNTSNRMIMKW